MYQQYTQSEPKPQQQHHNANKESSWTTTLGKMTPDIGPKKTMIVVVIVVGCFAVLWPKVFYPMLVGNASQYIKPSPIDKTTGCCDVFSEKDMNTVKIITELCRNMLVENTTDVKPSPRHKTSDKEFVAACRAEILTTCGIDITAIFQHEHVHLGANLKHILHAVRSLNGSLCLKYNYGVLPWQLGVPHRVLVDVKDTNIRQERPPLLRSEIIHPAFRERGAAIAPNHPSHSPHPSRQANVPQSPHRIIDGRPGPLPGIRPPMGGAGGVIPPSTKGTTSMSIIMPVYTIGIVIFFTYTLMKLIFKKQPEGAGGVLYPPVDTDRTFRRDVFEAEHPTNHHSHSGGITTAAAAMRQSRDVSSKLVVNAMSQLLDEVDEEIEARKKANSNSLPLNDQTKTPSENTNINTANGNLTNNKEQYDEKEQTSVKVVGMETTASCEGGQKWSRPNTPRSTPLPQTLAFEPKEPPQEIYLEGSLPAQSKLLVSDAKIETSTMPTNKNKEENIAVVSGKMTLSVISLDNKQDDQSDDDVEIEEIEEGIEDSKYTTASGATAAEPEVSDEELTDEENENELTHDDIITK